MKLSPAQADILDVIREYPGRTSAEIARRFGVTRGGIQHNLRVLVSLKKIEQRRIVYGGQHKRGYEYYAV